MLRLILCLFGYHGATEIGFFSEKKECRICGKEMED